MKSNNDTPETDAAATVLRGSCFGGMMTPHIKSTVPINAARKLERERDELREKYAIHYAEAEKLTIENAEMRKIIRRAAIAYEPMVAQSWLDDNPDKPETNAWIPLHDAPSISPCLVTDGINVEKARFKPRTREWIFSHAKLRLMPTHWMALPLPPNICQKCHNQRMIPSDDPNGDVMNTPCPECNEHSPNYATQRLSNRPV
jgi:hypothetical protein